MNIITRAQWGARPFKNPRRYVAISDREWFIIHYPGDGTPPRDVVAYAKWIERIHMDQNGWSGVGYNYFGSQGRVAEGCGRDVVGAHSPPHNVNGIGYNIWTSNGVPLDEDLAAARDVYERLSREAGHRLRIGWHGMDYPTECPGSILRNWAKAGMPYPPGFGPKPSKPSQSSNSNTGNNDPKEYDEMATKDELVTAFREALAEDRKAEKADRDWVWGENSRIQQYEPGKGPNGPKDDGKRSPGFVLRWCLTHLEDIKADVQAIRKAVVK